MATGLKSELIDSLVAVDFVRTSPALIIIASHQFRNTGGAINAGIAKVSGGGPGKLTVQNHDKIFQAKRNEVDREAPIQ